MITWKALENGWIYLNTNCANKEDNQEECGGLVRSDKSV